MKNVYGDKKWCFYCYSFLWVMYFFHFMLNELIYNNRTLFENIYTIYYFQLSRIFEHHYCTRFVITLLEKLMHKNWSLINYSDQTVFVNCTLRWFSQFSNSNTNELQFDRIWIGFKTNNSITMKMKFSNFITTCLSNLSQN